MSGPLEGVSGQLHLTTHSIMEHCLSLLLVLALGSLGAGHMFKAEIIGGREAAPHSRPYMASLQKARSHICGGVLVHSQWVLTAAHCLSKTAKLLTLVLGLHTLDNPNDPGLRFHLKKTVLHPDYKPPELENDLALLKLDGKVKPTKTIRPLPLPRGKQKVLAGARCSMPGWGQTHHGSQLARGLRELDVHVLDARQCNNSRYWNGSIHAHMVCFSAEVPHQGPCKGDSGGPLVCGKGFVAGILSFSSKTCTDVFKPPVATAVAPYMSWIKKTIRRGRSLP